MGLVERLPFITVTPYNRVGDQAFSKVGNKSKFTGKFTGPLKPGMFAEIDFPNAWYDNTIASIRINEVEIVNMDGTKKKIQKGFKEISHSRLEGIEFDHSNSQTYTVKVGDQLFRIAQCQGPRYSPGQGH